MEEERKAKLWNRYFIIACFCTVFTGICMRMLDSNLASFAANNFGSKALGGYLTSVFNIGSILMAFFTGRLVDRTGRQKCMVFGSLLFGVSTFAIAVWPTASVALTVRFIQGVAKGIVTVSAASIVSDVTPRERMSEGMGLYGLGNTITSAFGPMLALAITADGNYTKMFLLCGICYSIAGFLGMGITYEKKPEYAYLKERAAKNPTPSENSVEYKGIWKLIEKKALPASIVHTIFHASYACILVFLTIYAQEILGLTGTQIGLFHTFSAITMLVVRLFAGRLVDKHSALLLLVPAHILVVVLMLLMAFCVKGRYPLFLLCGAIYGFINASSTPTFNAIAIVDSPKDRNATASATYYFLMDFGILFASSFFGPIIDKAATPAAGYRSMFLISIGIAVVDLFLCLILFNNKAREKWRSKP